MNMIVNPINKQAESSIGSLPYRHQAITISIIVIIAAATISIMIMVLSISAVIIIIIIIILILLFYVSSFFFILISLSSNTITQRIKSATSNLTFVSTFANAHAVEITLLCGITVTSRYLRCRGLEPSAQFHGSFQGSSKVHYRVCSSIG